MQAGDALTNRSGWCREPLKWRGGSGTRALPPPARRCPDQTLGRGGGTYRSSGRPGRALVTPRSWSPLGTQDKYALATAPSHRTRATPTHDPSLSQSPLPRFPRGAPRGREGQGGRLSARLLLSSTGSPPAAAPLPLLLPKAPQRGGGAHVRLTCSPFRPSLCTCGANRRQQRGRHFLSGQARSAPLRGPARKLKCGHFRLPSGFTPL